MTDEEFNALLDRLFKLSSNDGDIGHEYWTGVINKLREMRKLAQENKHKEGTMNGNLQILLDYSMGRIGRAKARKALGVEDMILIQMLSASGFPPPRASLELEDEMLEGIKDIHFVCEPKKLSNAQLIVPDARILIALAHGDLLHILLEAVDNAYIVITDVAEFEAARLSDSFVAKKISDFISNNNVFVESTEYSDLIKVLKANPGIGLPASFGETAIYGYVNDLLSEKTETLTIVLLDDNWFLKNQLGSKPELVNLMSISSFLKYAEEVMPSLSTEDSLVQPSSV